MSVGRAVRTRLGRLEVPVSSFYRSMFIDLNACARLLAEKVSATTILEVGCGDGQLAGELLEWFPDASYSGIDIAPEVGRLYRGDPTRATFESIHSREFLEGTERRFGLVVCVDVLHHVPPEHRGDLLDDIRQLTATGGFFALKDWVRSRTPADVAAWASDRLLTGDRVSYFKETELRSLVPDRFPMDSEVLAARVPPRRNNLLLVYRRAAGNA